MDNSTWSNGITFCEMRCASLVLVVVFVSVSMSEIILGEDNDESPCSQKEDSPCSQNEDSPCSQKEEIVKTCIQTEYRKYIKCMKQKRFKRATCPNSGLQIIQAPVVAPPVNPYSITCAGAGCNVVQACTNGVCTGGQTIPICQQQYDACLSTCQVPTCRTQCQNTCPVVVTGGSSSQVVVDARTNGCTAQAGCSNQTKINETTGSLTHTITNSGVGGGSNITTIIKLTNLVNNTNIVNVPTQVNSTNINNINLSTNTTSGEWGLGATSKGSCCQAVQPRTCRQGRLGPRCQHRRHRTCGTQCTAPVIHVQSRRRCVAATQDCKHRVVYVPQPRPTCTYQSAWPYVSCNAHAQEQSLSCDGCYDHYGYGFQRFHQGQAPSCSGCFDDGFDQGPLYRQGPFYQPGFYHQPPAYQQGCGPEGCFGHQYVDPAYGGSSYNDYDLDYGDEYYTPGSNNTEEDEGSEAAADAKGVGCVITHQNGTQTKCTTEDVGKNPYAKRQNPSAEVNKNPPVTLDRNRRHSMEKREQRAPPSWNSYYQPPSYQGSYDPPMMPAPYPYPIPPSYYYPPAAPYFPPMSNPYYPPAAPAPSYYNPGRQPQVNRRPRYRKSRYEEVDPEEYDY